MKPQSLLAIDIVLLPNKDIIENIIQYNAAHFDETNTSLLNNDNRIPHITMRMGVIEKSNIQEVYNKLKEILIPELVTTIDFGKTRKTSYPSNLLLLKKDEELLNYHQEVMNLKGFIETPAQSTYFVENEPIQKSTINYLNSFQNYAFHNFLPHITLNKSKKPFHEFRSISFKPSVAIFQLGNRCTCNKLLQPI